MRETTSWRLAAKKGVATLMATLVSACGQVEPTGIDDGYVPELGVDPAALTPIGGTVSYVIAAGPTQGQMSIELAAGDVAFITRRSDGVITVNDVAVTGPGGVGYAYSTAVPGGGTGAVVKKITINSPSSDASEHVIIDFISLPFSLGSSGGAGWVVNLGSTGTDRLSFRGRESTSVRDNIKMGDSAINYTPTATADTIKDIDYTGVERFSFALLAGDDIFSAEGQASAPALGGPVTSNLVVYAGAGNDLLRGGDGDDTLYGNDGNDVFWTAPTDDGSDVYVGGAGTDAVSYGGKPAVNASNIVTGLGSSGARTAAVTVDIEAAAMGTNDDGEAGEADDVRDDIETLVGGDGADTLTGSSGANTLFGGDGNDKLAGGLGADSLAGGDGDDSMLEGAASTDGDVFQCGNGVDTVDYSGRMAFLTVTMDGSAADDGLPGEMDNVKPDCERLLGGAAADTLTGGPGNDTIYGNGGADTIHGGAGHDVIYGGALADDLYGDAGDDTFAEEAAANGGDTFNGGADRDTVDYSGRVGLDIVASIDGMADDGVGMENDNIATDCEAILGSDGDDSLTGGASDDYLDGGEGADTLSGLDGDDRIDGGEGTDVIDCGDGEGDICLDAIDCPAAVSCEIN